MGRVADLAREHPVITLMVSFFVLFAISSTIARLDAAHDGPISRLMHAERREGQATSAEEAALAEEPARLAALREANAPATADALAVLEANAWVDRSGTVVQFTPTCIRTRGEGGDTFEPYAVCASERRHVARDGVGSTVWVLSLETAAWSAICTLTVPTPTPSQAQGEDQDQGEAQDQDQQPARAGGEEGGRLPTLVCRDIASGSELRASSDLSPLRLVGPDEATLEAHGTTPEDVWRALSSWCVFWCPTATRATWDETILEDHAARAWEIPYELDDTYATKATVVVDMDTHEIEVRK